MEIKIDLRELQGQSVPGGSWSLLRQPKHCRLRSDSGGSLGVGVWSLTASDWLFPYIWKPHQKKKKKHPKAYKISPKWRWTWIVFSEADYFGTLQLSSDFWRLEVWSCMCHLIISFHPPALKVGQFSIGNLGRKVFRFHQPSPPPVLVGILSISKMPLKHKKKHAQVKKTTDNNDYSKLIFQGVFFLQKNLKKAGPLTKKNNTNIHDLPSPHSSMHWVDLWKGPPLSIPPVIRTLNKKLCQNGS